MKLAAAFAALLALVAPAHAEKHRDTSVPMKVYDINLTRYAGLWHEIARYPNFFERDCVGATADYSPRPDGKITVVNTCIRADGSKRDIEGRAEVVAPGRLKVGFVKWLPAFGDYWVLHVEPDYSLAAVGEPSGGYGWILARDERPNKAAVARALKAFETNGYDTKGLIWLNTED